MKTAAFSTRLLRWHARHGRHDLPWQRTRDPYRVWLSEIMLQQTQVATVVPYFERFVRRFPDVFALAAAALDEVMPLWAGLGYYARARNLHACARAVAMAGGFPRSAQALAELPGIGESTAAAIAAFCFDERAAILDGNVKRVLARHAGIDGDPDRSATARRLRELAQQRLPAADRMPAYTQAIMDLGATLCTRAEPDCRRCPVAADCIARCTNRVHELPTPRRRPAAPLRRAQMLIALHRGAVFLQQRPPTGIWGALWCPPQTTRLAEMRAIVARLSAGGARPRLQRWPARQHAFTHFRLRITPYLLRLEALAPHAAEPGSDWLPLAQLEQAAVPAPIRRLLREARAAA